MTVIMVESVTPSLRGELSRWMIEPHAGLFVGSISAQVRDLLWEHVCQRCSDGGAVMIRSAPNEQGFEATTWGRTKREIVDFDGLVLVRVSAATEG